MEQLQDNHLAIAEGASGAPKILSAALEQTPGIEAVTNATVRAKNITLAKITV